MADRAIPRSLSDERSDETKRGRRQVRMTSSAVLRVMAT